MNTQRNTLGLVTLLAAFVLLYVVGREGPVRSSSSSTNLQPQTAAEWEIAVLPVSSRSDTLLLGREVELWLGVTNQQTSDSIVCLSGSSYHVFEAGGQPERMASLWPRSGHTCMSWSRSRHLVLAGETLYEYARFSADQIPETVEVVTLSLSARDFGEIEGEPRESTVRLKSTLYDARDGNPPENTSVVEANTNPNGPSIWSLVLRRHQGRPGEDGGFWVGLRNESRFGKVIGWPAISYEVNFVDGRVEHGTEDPIIETRGRSKFLVLPGQTFFSLKKLLSDGNAISSVAEVTLSVVVNELLMDESDVRLGEQITVEWSGDLRLQD